MGRWLVALVIVTATARAAKPVDTRLLAVLGAAKDVVALCAEQGATITRKQFEAAVLAQVPAAPASAPVKVSVPSKHGDDGFETCTAQVDILLVDGQLWVRIQAPLKIPLPPLTRD